MENYLPKNILKYISKNTLSLNKTVFKEWPKIKMAVVIPAIKEFNNIKKLLRSLAGNDNYFFNKSIILFVINNLKSSSAEIKVENRQTIEYLKRIINKNAKDEFENEIVNSGLNIALIDAATEGNELDEKHGGVGLARKIGMDAVLNNFDFKTEGKNIIVCLDADCTVDKNYLIKIYTEFLRENISAGYVNFKHFLPDSLEKQLAIINYEIFLRYYILGLTFAQSPFAFYSIGSTMICDAESYVKVGGMNKKKAAEDFYFMEKLAKISTIKKISETTVYPSGRGSQRVPFGTGQRVNRFLEHTHNEYLLYSPESFVVLKNWLEIYNSPEKFEPEKIMKRAEKISDNLFSFLEQNNFVSDWEKILKNTKSEDQLYKQKIMWFDGFKTLKLIHYLRDNSFPQINMFAAVENLFKYLRITPIQNKKRLANIPDLNIQLRYLNKLREIV